MFGVHVMVSTSKDICPKITGIKKINSKGAKYEY